MITTFQSDPGVVSVLIGMIRSFDPEELRKVDPSFFLVLKKVFFMNTDAVCLEACADVFGFLLDEKSGCQELILPVFHDVVVSLVETVKNALDQLSDSSDYINDEDLFSLVLCTSRILFLLGKWKAEEFVNSFAGFNELLEVALREPAFPTGAVTNLIRICELCAVWALAGYFSTAVTATILADSRIGLQGNLKQFVGSLRVTLDSPVEEIHVTGFAALGDIVPLVSVHADFKGLVTENLLTEGRTFFERFMIEADVENVSDRLQVVAAACKLICSMNSLGQFYEFGGVVLSYYGRLHSKSDVFFKSVMAKLKKGSMAELLKVQLSALEYLWKVGDSEQVKALATKFTLIVAFDASKLLFVDFFKAGIDFAIENSDNAEFLHVAVVPYVTRAFPGNAVEAGKYANEILENSEEDLPSKIKEAVIRFCNVCEKRLSSK